MGEGGLQLQVEAPENTPRSVRASWVILIL
jgi:hypothetical protein